MSITNEDIVAHAGVGATVNNIDLSSPLGVDEVQTLKLAMGTYGVLYFRDQSLSEDGHIKFAEQFGNININRFFTPVESHPQIAEVRKEPTQKINIGSKWHTDHSYDTVPAMGSVLVARETPSTGGDTVFANMLLAYETLSDGLKHTLCGLQAVHSSRHVFGASKTPRYDSGDTRIGNPDLAKQDAVHPVVIRHPFSGKAALYINPEFTLRFEGWTAEESKSLMDYLVEHTIRHEHTHRFQWAPGSVAFWDNRATWHYAINDYHGERRLMHRITVEGEALYAHQYDVGS